MSLRAVIDRVYVAVLALFASFFTPVANVFHFLRAEPSMPLRIVLRRFDGVRSLMGILIGIAATFSMTVTVDADEAVQTIVTVGSTFGLNSGRHTLLTGRSGAGSQEIPTPMPVSGVIRNWKFRQLTAPGAGGNWTWKIQKNGVDTALSITIAGTSTEGFDTDSVSFAAGDTIRITSTRGGSPLPAASEWQSSVEFDPDVDGISIYGFGADSIGGTEYDNALYGTLFDGFADRQYSIVAAAGTITTWRLAVNGAPGVGKSRTFTLIKNGVAQDGTGGTPDTRLTIADSATVGSADFTLTVAPYDQLQIRHMPTNTPAGGTNVLGGVAFLPVTVGQWMLSYGNAVGMNTNGTPSFHWPIGGDQSGTTTESAREAIGGSAPFTVYTMQARISNPPGAGKSWTLTLRKNQADTPLSITITGNNVEGTATGSVTIEPGDRFSVKAVASGGPSSITARSWVSLLAMGGNSIGLGPNIATLTPSSAYEEQGITITGTNFGAVQGASTVTFNGIAATIQSWSDTSISAVVPVGATAGPVMVTVNGFYSNRVSFSVLYPPEVASLTPPNGSVGQAVTIAGSNFGATQGGSTVTFAGTAAMVVDWSDTSITVIAPATAIGPIDVDVTVNGRFDRHPFTSILLDVSCPPQGAPEHYGPYPVPIKNKWYWTAIAMMKPCETLTLTFSATSNPANLQVELIGGDGIRVAASGSFTCNGSCTVEVPGSGEDTWRGSRGLAGRVTAVRVQVTAGDNGQTSYNLDVTKQPRFGYNVGGDTFANAAMLSSLPQLVFASLMTREVGQYFSISLGAGETISLSGNASTRWRYGTRLHMDIHDATFTRVVDQWTPIYENYSFSFPTFTNTSPSPQQFCAFGLIPTLTSDTFCRIWCYSYKEARHSASTRLSIRRGFARLLSCTTVSSGLIGERTGTQ